MAHIKRYNSGVDRLDKAVFRWLNTDQGESCIKSDIEKKWDEFLDPADIESGTKYTSRRNQLNLKWIVAASIAVLLAVGAMWFYADRNKNPNQHPFISRITEEIRLTLPDGEQILLDPHTDNGIVAQHGGVSLISENGTLIHEKLNTVGGSGPESQWSTLDIPRGNQFDLILEDGTHVWLNAGSRIRFPIMFGDGIRRVFIEGEAFFTVTRDTVRPFIVETPRQDITVSGTEFNVYAYPDEPVEHTTLIEGGVILTSRNNDSVTLAPGQQAVLLIGKYIVRQIDAYNAAAWRDGIFVLDGNTFGEAFLKLSRWYGFTYSFSDEELVGLTFSGNLRRYDDVRVILDIFETIAQVTINVKDNHIEIMKK